MNQPLTKAGTPPAEPKPKVPRKAYVRAVHGDMVHLITAKRITKVPAKLEVDDWLQAQIDAGKVVEGEED